MIPILYPADASDFDAPGTALPDAVSCTVKQDAEAHSELTLQYPLTGQNFGQILPQRIILMKPDPYTRPQPFRIYKTGKPISGLVSFSARHIAYDALGIPVRPFRAVTASQAAAALISGALTTCPFTLTTDMSKAGEMLIEEPDSLRALLVTDANSLLNVYGGYLLFDRWAMSHRTSPGENRGVVIRYGVDLVDMQQEEKIADTYTGVYPYWKGVRTTTTYPLDPTSEDDETVTQEEVVVLGAKRAASGTFPVEKIQVLDLSDQFENPPAASQLNAMADAWIAENRVGVPQVSIRMKFAQIGQDVRLLDTVGVSFPLLGVETTSRVTATVFDGLDELYTDVQIGTPRQEITGSLSDASRLRHGKLPSARIGSGSIGGRQLSTAAVSERALAAYAVTKSRLADLSVSTQKLKDDAVKENKIKNDAVTVNKIKNGAVVSAKIADDAVTTNKVLNKAIEYAKLSEELQIFVTDILAANAIYSSVIDNDGSISTSVLTIKNNGYISMGGDIYKPKTYTVQDTRKTYSINHDLQSINVPVYDGNGDWIGSCVEYANYPYLTSGSETATTYNLAVIGKIDIQ